jgi:hypothetical protein
VRIPYRNLSQADIHSDQHFPARPSKSPRRRRDETFDQYKLFEINIFISTTRLRSIFNHSREAVLTDEDFL